MYVTACIIDYVHLFWILANHDFATMFRLFRSLAAPRPVEFWEKLRQTRDA